MAQRGSHRQHLSRMPRRVKWVRRSGIVLSLLRAVVVELMEGQLRRVLALGANIRCVVDVRVAPPRVGPLRVVCRVHRGICGGVGYDSYLYVSVEVEPQIISRTHLSKVRVRERHQAVAVYTGRQRSG